MKISHKEAKTILTPSKLPGADYVVNPYSGCAFGCVYCYADFTRKFTGHMEDKWGEYVDIKINTPEIFEKELSKLTKKIVKKNEFKKGDKPVIFFGSVTDPYQGVEAKYELTRKCLEIIAKSDIRNDIKISLLTKSPLVARDIVIFKQIPNLEIGMTITSIDDEVSKMFESCAPSSSLRIKALNELNKEGINTYAFVGPLLPHFVANEKSLNILFMKIKESGTNKVWVEHINLKGKKMGRLIELVGENLSKEEYELFVNSQTDEYKNRLNEIIMKIIKKYDLELVGGKVIDHIKLEK
ncbi:MAG: radical SAM protein [Candidatus Dojkabacteria bacterium]|nr:radical SAM protein [Candidatus Dojkabacteria bacterium]